MPANIMQTNFAAGALSPKLAGRIDFPAISSGAEILKNFLVQPQGDITRRPGTRFVAEVRDSTAKVRLVDFVFNEGDAYVLEFGNLYVRFYQNGGQVKETLTITAASFSAGTATVTCGAHSATIGDSIVVAGVNPAGYNGTFLVTGTSGTTISYALAADPGAYVADGTAQPPLEVTTPYTTAQLAALAFAQSGDVVYITHGSHAPRTLKRLAATSFTLTTVIFRQGPFQTISIDGVLMKADAVEGSVTITASAVKFAATDVGRLLRLRAPVSLGVVSIASSVFTLDGHRLENGDRVRFSTDGTLPTPLSDIFIFYVTNSSQGAGTFRIATTLGGAPAAISGGSGAHTIGNVDDAKWNWGEITGFTDDRNVTMEIKNNEPAGRSGNLPQSEDTRFVSVETGRNDANKLKSLMNTDEWALGEWSTTTSYPSQVAFFQQRLCFAASADKPQTVWMSVIADFENFKPTEDDDSVLDDNAVSATIASGRADKILWMAAERVLMVGTEGGPKAISGGRDSAAVTPSNIEVRRASAFGAAPDVRPLAIGNDVLYAQSALRKLRALNFQFQQENFGADDLTIFADNITRGGISEMAHADQPDSLVWAVLTNGQGASMTFDRAQKLSAWSNHEFGGSFSGGIAEAESVTVIPTTTYDQAWFIIKRTINGVTKRYVEFLDVVFERGDTQADAHYVDSGLTYSGALTDTLTGLDHLEGESVLVLADGAEHIPVTVSGGAITLQYEVTKARVGLKYNSDLKPMPLSVGNPLRTIQGRPGKITQTTVKLHETIGLRYGTDFDNLDEFPFRDPADPPNAAIPLFSGDIRLTLEGPLTTEMQVCLRMDGSSPGTILALIYQFEAGARQ